VRKKDGANFAVKKIDWSNKKQNESLFLKELKVLQQLRNHQNVARLIG
jgi:hypothetical protein